MRPYTAFGLQIESEISLPEVPPGTGAPADVRIRYAPVPDTVTDPPTFPDGYFHATNDSLLLVVNDVGRYYVEKGKNIRIEPAPDCSEDVLRVYLMGSVLGALLQQRGFMVMHASAILTARGAVLFVGECGHGKSTLLAALVRRGFPMLSDDVTAVQVESPSGPLAFGSFPTMRLNADAASRLNWPVEGLPRVPTTDKSVVPVSSFVAGPEPVHAVLELNVHDATSIDLEPVDNADRFAILGANSYRSLFLGWELRQRHFHQAVALAKAVSVGRIRRPASPFMIDELVDRVVVEFGEPVNTAREKEVV